MKNKVLTLLNPDTETLKEIIRNAKVNKKILVIFGKFSIKYSGRASSSIESGERILIYKEDGALIIHRPYGYKPINWQPNTEVIRFSSVGDKFKAIFIRKKPREFVEVTFDEVYLVCYGKLVDHAEFEMHLTEEELKQVIKKYPELIEPGIRIIKEEKEIEVGKIDLFARDSRGNIVIIELKKGRITENEVLQLYRYVEYFRKTNPQVRGVIVGTAITANAKILLSNLKLEFKSVNLKKISKMKYT